MMMNPFFQPNTGSLAMMLGGRQHVRWYLLLALAMGIWWHVQHTTYSTGLGPIACASSKVGRKISCYPRAFLLQTSVLQNATVVKASVELVDWFHLMWNFTPSWVLFHFCIHRFKLITLLACVGSLFLLLISFHNETVKCQTSWM